MNVTARLPLVPAAVAGLAVLAAIAGCSSSSSSTSTGSTRAAERQVYAGPLIVQCALTRGLMKPPTAPTQTPWLKGTKLVITPANVSQFNSWYSTILGTVVAGQEIEDWAQQTASSGKLPAAVCGTSVTASELQKQVFAGDPAAGDPWG